MLSSFRAIAKSKITLVVLFVPLVLGLLVFGNVQDAFSGMSGKDAVIAAGDRAVTSLEFKTAFDKARKDYAERAGAPISVEEAVAQGGMNDILEILANREGFMAVLTKAGMRPSDKMVADQMHKIPVFFDPITGQFDPAQYRARLAEQGLTTTAFEQGMRDELRQGQFGDAVAGGMRSPAVFSAMAAAMQFEQRAFTVFGIDPRTITPPPAPTDAQLIAFMKAHAAEMTLPEQRTITVARFSARAIEPSVTVDQAELQKRYDFRKDTLSTPERRTLVQIPAKSAQDAAAAAARLAKGEDPAVVAKALSVEPISYADSPQSALPDPKIAQAAFAAPVGAVTPPVQGGLGWAVVKVLAVTPGKAVTYEQARPSLEAELRAEAAQDKIYEVVDKYQKAHDGGANLPESARAAGVNALQLPRLTAEGADETGQPQPLLSPKALKAAFALPEGGESEVEDEGKGEYFAVRVDKIFPAALPSLADRRPMILAAYNRFEMTRVLKARVDALAERVRKGESMDAVAASVGQRAQHIDIDRRTAEQDKTGRAQLFAQVFAAKPGSVISAGPVVMRIDSVRLSSPQNAAVFTRLVQRQMSAAMMQDIAAQAYRWTRKEAKVKIDVNRARAALGLPPIKADGTEIKPADPAAK